MRHRRRAARVDWTGWEPPDRVLEDIRRYMRRHRRSVLVIFIALCGAFVYGLYDAQKGRSIECRHSNETRAALRTIIQRGDANIAQLVKEGTITAAQAKRSLEQSRRARALLLPYSCTSA